jgi:hypothetical protein
MHAAGVRELGAPVELLGLPGPRALRPDEGVVLLTHPWQGGIDAAGLAFGLAAGACRAVTGFGPVLARFAACP